MQTSMYSSCHNCYYCMLLSDGVEELLCVECSSESEQPIDFSTSSKLDFKLLTLLCCCCRRPHNTTYFALIFRRLPTTYIYENTIPHNVYALDDFPFVYNSNWFVIALCNYFKLSHLLSIFISIWSNPCCFVKTQK